MNTVSILMLTFSICFELSDGFFARTIRDGNGMTKTHLDITAAGTIKSIDKYIKSNKGFGSIDDFFSGDTNRKDTMMKKVFALRKAVADTQENKKDIAYIHCHADQIDLGINTLMDVAALEEDTCLDNADYNSECKNNIIVSGKLTSGYHHRRGNTKPASR
ncbi:unnamed protein product [Mytilus edulis]|uniref:Uncharacterized protein n=1 Tax=Mytilus edulis TaxID=6550 RepID=A0A8S3QP95_MYTED|nr:unnamed protein product [Mytilus edulis]